MGREILVVEEDTELCASVAGCLTAAGYRVVTSPDRAGALFQLGLHKPDLVVLGESEPDLLPRVRELTEGPIIALTHDDLASRISSLDRGADYIVARPPNNRELVAKVRALLRRLEKPCRQSWHPVDVASTEP